MVAAKMVVALVQLVSNLRSPGSLAECSRCLLRGRTAAPPCDRTTLEEGLDNFSCHELTIYIYICMYVCMYIYIYLCTTILVKHTHTHIYIYTY